MGQSRFAGGCASITTMLIGLIITGALIVNKATPASATDHAGQPQEIQDFTLPLPERMEKKSFASFRFRPKGLKDLDTLEDAYKVMDQLNHFTQRRGQEGHHVQNIPQYEVTGQVLRFKYQQTFGNKVTANNLKKPL